MTSLIAAEWIKLRHRWMPRVLVLLTLIAVALLFCDTISSCRTVGSAA
jgi:hypothetical protein